MGKMFDDFKKYAKEEFECDVYLKESSFPMTFESIFGIRIDDEEPIKSISGSDDSKSNNTSFEIANYQTISIDDTDKNKFSFDIDNNPFAA